MVKIANNNKKKPALHRETYKTPYEHFPQGCKIYAVKGANVVLTFCLGTDEAGGGAVKEGEKAGHG